MVANAAAEFDDSGRLKEERYRKALGELMSRLRTEAGQRQSGA